MLHIRRLPALLLAALLTFSACAANAPAIVTTQPTVDQVGKDRDRAVQAATAITGGLMIVTQALETADVLEQAKIISPALLRQLVAVQRRVTAECRRALDIIEGVTAGKEVNLSTTLAVVLKEFNDFLTPLETSKNDRLRDLALAARAILSIITVRGDL